MADEANAGGQNDEQEVIVYGKGKKITTKSIAGICEKYGFDLEVTGEEPTAVYVATIGDDKVTVQFDEKVRADKTRAVKRGKGEFSALARAANAQYAIHYETNGQKEKRLALSGADDGGDADSGDADSGDDSGDKLPVLGKRLLKKYDRKTLEATAEVLAEVIEAKKILEANAAKIGVIENDIGTVNDLLAGYKAIELEVPKALTAKLASLKEDLKKAKSGK
jgi:hypothetical protein